MAFKLKRWKSMQLTVLKYEMMQNWLFHLDLFLFVFLKSCCLLVSNSSLPFKLKSITLSECSLLNFCCCYCVQWDSSLSQMLTRKRERGPNSCMLPLWDHKTCFYLDTVRRRGRKKERNMQVCHSHSSSEFTGWRQIAFFWKNLLKRSTEISKTRTLSLWCILRRAVITIN